ncbi:class I SAM-dependent DNA methyltransferase [Sphingomonas sanguinis]|uniref:site-specific DNA-methyltransferase (adenine-specific) n=1 Tax=Sphingomonas sanguinis TaxID=33051 RepID=A0A147HTE0_9SPHN|nr:DNA methyltransferase [Sphingomonas sanguinis]KTT68113.1 restriction endonuclease subunit M [Sphingomonas sanguinis]
MATATAIEAFIQRWQACEGGAERANYALFLTELCAIIGVAPPDPAHATSTRNDYVFERAVVLPGGDEDRRGRIDLYKRGCFVLEAKQSREGLGAKSLAAEGPMLPGLLPDEAGAAPRSRQWDVLMRRAREQAEQYARALPVEHGWPPFLIVVDVGRVIELFADFSGQGKHYKQFPDRARFRIALDDLRREEVRQRLATIWDAPLSLDPTRHAAAVTRDVAARLASISKLLEERGHDPEGVALFLMRCLFTMFAEHSGLLPAGGFVTLLSDARERPDAFVPWIEDLWHSMDRGGEANVLRCAVRRFNGGLFHTADALPLNREEIGELLAAARRDWRDVEPAIFGTLLEQALDPVQRRRLGTHYTPRAYVERLVTATVMEPLRDDWAQVLSAVEAERPDNPRAAVQRVRDFHRKLATTRVLDPACGTGNFLYVTLELMKRLEGEVLEVLAELSGEEILHLDTETVHPRNFYGIEYNARAAAIAQLVLWLGYIRWQLRNGGQVSDPVLEDVQSIVTADALLTPSGAKTPWPEAEFIVGNPPFIGGKDLRGRLPQGMAEALWRAYPKMPRAADYVLYWWDRAAQALAARGSPLIRFGFVTTNSITQTFGRRVIARAIEGPVPLSILHAIPDHPWTKATPDAAMVRIAMTVVARGSAEGRRLRIVHESALDSDTPTIRFAETIGRINADLSVGANVGSAQPLLANSWLCSRGVSLHGAGFIVSPAEAMLLGLGRREGLERHIRPYCHGRDLTARTRGAMVIDLLGLSEAEVRQRFPEVYGHLLRTVRVSRQAQFARSPTADAAAYLDKWWLMGKPRTELRSAFEGLSRYIATVETAKHRLFQFLGADTLPDNKLICIAAADAWILGVLHSSVHEAWYLANAGMLGVYDQPAVYVKTTSFDPFAFPEMGEATAANIAALAEELDATRKRILAEVPDLTLTGLYNLRAKLVAGTPLTDEEQDLRRAGSVDLIARLHDQIDAAVIAAYGWPATITAPAMVERLVALNAERRAEERSGRVQWLRPDFQSRRAGATPIAPTDRALPLVEPTTAKPVFPRDLGGRIASVFALLATDRPLSATAIAQHFAQGRQVERAVAAALAGAVRLGYVAQEPDGYRLRRVA